MKYSQIHLHRRSRGTAMLVVMLLVFCCTTAITGWLYLTAARINQSEQLATAATRHTVMGNTTAVNKQNTLANAFGDGVTQNNATTTLPSNWGGVSSNGFAALSTFKSTNRPSANTYPFNNIRPIPTTDGGTYFDSYFEDSDSTQSEHYYLYNYLKTYPGTLMGDLLICHKKPTNASSYSVARNFQINGRIVVYDSTANVSLVRAQACISVNGAAVTATNIAGTASLLPDNYPDVPTGHVGYGGTSAPYLVTDGTLNMVNNTVFTPASLYNTVTTTTNFVTAAVTSILNLITGVLVGNPSSLPYTAPSTSPYGYTPSLIKKVLTVNLLTSTSNVVITGAYDQIVLQGATTTSNYNSMDSLAPLVILMQSNSTRDIRLVGENNRRLILATSGSGATIYMGFTGSSLIGGGPLRWRLQLINEYRDLWFASPSNGVLITGGIRTNYGLNCADNTTSIRYTVQRETDPGDLETLLPRDGWHEAYLYLR